MNTTKEPIKSEMRSRALAALIVSLAVYAVPIVSAHWVGLLGPTLVSELGSERPADWIAADVAMAVVAQIVLGGVAWLALRWGRLACAAVMIVACVPLVYCVNVAYMVSIPSMFLIEDDHTPDIAALPVVCAVPHVSLVPAPSGITRTIDARGAALVGTGDGQYGILRVPQCVVEPVAIPRLPIAPGIQQVTADGSVLYLAYERGVPTQTFWLLRRETTEPVQIVPPAGVSSSYPFPLLSNDARWVAWTMGAPGGPVSIQLTPLDGGEPRVIAHDLLQRATMSPVELDVVGGTLVVNRNLDTFVALDLEGGVSWGPLTPPGLAVQPQTLRYDEGQWLAWDAYVEGRPKRAAWSTRAGQGSYTVPLGRGITAAALSFGGRFVAFSTTTELNIGSIADTVLVKRASDGADVFRRTLPPYARSHVAFLGERHFAYTDVAAATATTRVIALPE
jgi:hypothetical protein